MRPYEPATLPLENLGYQMLFSIVNYRDSIAISTLLS